MRHICIFLLISVELVSVSCLCALLVRRSIFLTTSTYRQAMGLQSRTLCFDLRFWSLSRNLCLRVRTILQNFEHVELLYCEGRWTVLKFSIVFLHWLILLLEYIYNVENITHCTGFNHHVFSWKYVRGICMLWNADLPAMMDVTTKDTRNLRCPKLFKWFTQICRISTGTPTRHSARNFVRIFSNSLVYKIKTLHSGFSAIS